MVLAIALLFIFPLALRLGGGGRSSGALFLILLLPALARLSCLFVCALCGSALLRLALSCTVIFFQFWLHNPRRQTTSTCGLRISLSREREMR
jgi:hypothetical protein